MQSTCEKCGASINSSQTFCRSCGALTGVVGAEPTILINRPGPDASSPWAKIGSHGDGSTSMSNLMTRSESSSFVTSSSNVLGKLNTTQNPLDIRHNSDTRHNTKFDTEKTRIVRSSDPLAVLVGWLVALSGPHAGTDWRIQRGRNLIGRSPESNITLKNDDSVSSVHAFLWVNEGNVATLIDKDSSNGTYVNSKQIFTPVEICDKDLIRLGDVSVLQWVFFNKVSLP